MAYEYKMIIEVGISLLAIVLLIGMLKIPPFVGIFIGALFAGLMMGLQIDSLLPTFIKGAGEIMGATGLIIAAGAMLGGILAESGAAECIACALLKNTPQRYISWMVAVCAMVIGLPLFFEVALVMMLPMIIALWRHSNLPFVRIAIPALAGMTTLHALIPPHPGPLIAINELHADLGLTMIVGIIIAIPTVIISGPLYSYWFAPKQGDIGKNISIPLNVAHTSKSLPPLSLCFGVILLPIFLMTLHSYMPILLGSDSRLLIFTAFVGQPLVALVIAVIFAAFVLGKSSKWSLSETGNILQKNLPPIAALILTIGAGGGLKQILLQGGISEAISKMVSDSHISLLLLAWCIAVLIRQATGSATVATTTTSGIIASLATGMSGLSGALLVLVIGSGSVFFCHINDAGFWMVKSFFQISLKQTLWMWSILQTLVSVCGLVFCMFIWYFILNQ
ncbi:GntP family permease [Helicobacter cappadocius]|uniref:Gluconate:H+ symporter n=1 Tax=Helicobacter cappadocius TaxID=3063998 RepID=A0AA90PTA1_9HELI|nr:MULTISPECIES: gluconate:H+ symporter [unclassified Helicobacter]MDO7252478.1 gluconate:H+ symporter [Helicobacter sp. faydin-H75]MDP2538345.1 gluconate:H+ symporter [Helicobacter sp. faydin-H76]